MAANTVHLPVPGTSDECSLHTALYGEDGDMIDEHSQPPEPAVNMFVPRPATPLEPGHVFGGSGVTVGEFWRWAYSDLRSNVVRGVLAEFLVAKALADPSPLRDAWDNHDVTTANGLKVEVKSSGYLQSWSQSKLSSVSFGRLTGKSWVEGTGYSIEREIRADVFVFAIHICKVPDDYDPLDIAQWEFHVAPAAAVKAHGWRSAGVGFLKRWCSGPHPWHELAAAVDTCATAGKGT